MAVVEVIQDIRSRISAGQFPSEASVAQGIVLRLLASLGWPQFDTELVWPEYSLEGRRVDFALCNPPKRPIAFNLETAVGHVRMGRHGVHFQD